ncbi:amidase [Sediminicoccus rosea]|jgi:aspartyl-tRNA(Asn)/glutamyl-tRNA(Gln) amidotransferase subunit A|uniref:Amidase n=1 Tax=Sediminicoccus rosea TaxID=1225128 RepID=A0ABZ0PLT2_9PROT|nr:amidase [Sediminicoccus rosea]WPB86050.1 amidase [Sediminicoccus rosea]
MTTEPTAPLSATAMAEALERRAVTPATLLADALARVARADATLGAFVHLDPDGAARAAAEAGARQAAGRRLSPLDGVPVAVKDNIWVAGMPAHWGSRMWSDFTPPCDDIVVERLRAAGAVIIGKTNTPEFALSGRTDSPLHGKARNPWNPALTPGGSSGGSVAAVAAGMVPFSVATDAGGSTRIPASYTGLYGLRPSNGRLARRHGFPPMGIDFQAVGILARELADLELAYGLLAGPDERDPASLRFPPPRAAGRPRIGWFARYEGELVHPEVEAAVIECARLLEAAGYEVTPCPPPYDVALVRRVWGAISSAGAARAAELHPERWRKEASGAIAAAAERGLAMSAVDYVRALDGLAALRAQVSENWGAADVYLCPSAASPAWAIDDEFPAEIGGKPGHAAAQNTFATWVNAVGHPGLSIPGRPHADGRPLGVQLVGRFGGEADLFALARVIAAAAPWTRPPFPAW